MGSQKRLKGALSKDDIPSEMYRDGSASEEK